MGHQDVDQHTMYQEPVGVASRNSLTVSNDVMMTKRMDVRGDEHSFTLVVKDSSVETVTAKNFESMCVRRHSNYLAERTKGIMCMCIYNFYCTQGMSIVVSTETYQISVEFYQFH